MIHVNSNTNYVNCDSPAFWQTYFRNRISITNTHYFTNFFKFKQNNTKRFYSVTSVCEIKDVYIDKYSYLLEPEDEEKTLILARTGNQDPNLPGCLTKEGRAFLSYDRYPDSIDKSTNFVKDHMDLEFGPWEESKNYPDDDDLKDYLGFLEGSESRPTVQTVYKAAYYYKLVGNIFHKNIKILNNWIFNPNNSSLPSHDDLDELVESSASITNSLYEGIDKVYGGDPEVLSQLSDLVSTIIPVADVSPALIVTATWFGKFYATPIYGVLRKPESVNPSIVYLNSSNALVNKEILPDNLDSKLKPVHGILDLISHDVTATLEKSDFEFDDSSEDS